MKQLEIAGEHLRMGVEVGGTIITNKNRILGTGTLVQ